MINSDTNLINLVKVKNFIIAIDSHNVRFVLYTKFLDAKNRVKGGLSILASAPSSGSGNIVFVGSSPIMSHLFIS